MESQVTCGYCYRFFPPQHVDATREKSKSLNIWV